MVYKLYGDTFLERYDNFQNVFMSKIHNLQTYSIPLNTPNNSRYCRMVQKCRTNMIETVLESSWSPLSENMYIIGIISTHFCKKKAKRKISQTLNTWKMTEISKVSVCFEKQVFVFCALSEAQLHFYAS